MIKNDLILDAAAEVLSKRPDATLQTIATAAGVSRTTIFNKFPTRDVLLQALARDALDRIGEVMAKVPDGDGETVSSVIAEVTAGLMPLGPRTMFLRVVPGLASDLDMHWERAVTPLAVYIHNAQSRRLVRSDHPARWLVASYIGLLFAAWDEIANGENGRAQAARLVVQTWLDGSLYTPET
ncbi:TetR/AcrR family transcriptional regulator [bacterium]|nr:TetR/AcrR family transcriptional regulator [bacterium]